MFRMLIENGQRSHSSTPRNDNNEYHQTMQDFQNRIHRRTTHSDVDTDINRHRNRQRLSNGYDDINEELEEYQQGRQVTMVYERLTFDRRFMDYIEDIGHITNMPVSMKQRRLIRQALDTGAFMKVHVNRQQKQEIKDRFEAVKDRVISEWEYNTGVSWPKYEQPVIVNGRIMRLEGHPYDVHHIIETSYGGPWNVWWNCFPASFPDQHQNGIHRKDGPAEIIFGSS